MTDDTKNMTLREFGRLVGVGREAIRKAIKTERISRNLVATTRIAGRLVTVISDVESARDEFIRNTNVACRRVGGLSPSSSESRAIIEFYKSKLACLDYETRSSKLVDAEEFRRRFAAMAERVQARMLRVAADARTRIPHLGPHEIAIIDGLIREAIEGLIDVSTQTTRAKNQ